MSLFLGEVTVDIETFDIVVATQAVEVEVVTTEMPSVELGVPGPLGPPGPVGPAGPVGPYGPAGITRVNHGTNANMSRPAAPIVLWVGSVTPANRDETVDLIAWTA